MSSSPRALSNTFKAFFNSEKSSGVVLIVCTVTSLVLANSSLGSSYAALWHTSIGGLSLDHWINDALMAVFFLLIGLELERELYSGELSSLRRALLPMFAAIGGAIVPALIHFSLNAGQPTQAGFGIPMATDIAFALGALALLGSAIPAPLKTFVVAFAVFDDLIAVLIIAAVYTENLSIAYLIAALAVFGLLLCLNRVFRVMSLTPYLLGGALMWVFMLKSGVHATVAGIILAFAIPFSHKAEDAASPSHRLENFLHKPVAFMILPIFALANTAIVVGSDWLQGIGSANSLGIITGLIVGKPLGIVALCFIGVASGACHLPKGLGWQHIVGAGALGGIGFTMSIFITNLAFAADVHTVNASKLAVLLASLCAGAIGLLWLKFVGKSGEYA
jgi:NhaA family Na+:H+ antiporter